MRATHKKKLDSLPPREAVFIEPMECAFVPDVPDGPQWIYEVKLDGYRAIAVKSESKLALRQWPMPLSTFRRRQSSMEKSWRSTTKDAPISISFSTHETRSRTSTTLSSICWFMRIVTLLGCR